MLGHKNVACDLLSTDKINSRSTLGKLEGERNSRMNVSRREFLLTGLGMVGWAAHGALCSHSPKGKTMSEKKTNMTFTLQAIGTVEKNVKQARLRIFDQYADALKGLDRFSHVFVFYWFHKNDTPQKRSILQVHPQGNRHNPLTGVFACRAPVRPNLIALSLCKILSVKDGVVRVDKIDAFDGSPILDLKPYIPTIDETQKDVRLPDWLSKKR